MIFAFCFKLSALSLFKSNRFYRRYFGYQHGRQQHGQQANAQRTDVYHHKIEPVKLNGHKTHVIRRLVELKKVGVRLKNADADAKQVAQQHPEADKVKSASKKYSLYSCIAGAHCL